MTISVTDVNVTTDTFRSWVTITNQLANAMSNHVLTAHANSTGSDTTGNTNLNGTLSANTIAVKTNLRGGTVDTPANLSIVSNAAFTGTDLQSTANVYFDNANTFVDAGSLTVQGGNVAITSNVMVSLADAATISPFTLTVGSNNFNITSNTYFTGANNRFFSANVMLSGGAVNFTSNIVFTAANAFISGNTIITGQIHNVQGNVAFDSNTLFVDAVNNRIGINNTAPDTQLTVIGNANVSANVVVGGALNLLGNSTISNTVVVLTSNTTTTNATITAAAINLRSNSSVTAVSVLGNTTATNTTIGGTTLNIPANTSGTGTLLWTNSSVSLNSNNSLTAIAVRGDGTVTNTTIVGNTTTIQSNTIVLKSNSAITAVTVTGNSTVTNTIIGGSQLFVNAPAVNVSSQFVEVTANTTLKSNTSINAVVVTGNATATNVALQGTTVYINSNSFIQGSVHTVSGNVNIDAGALFVDSVTNRVGVNNTTPDASLTVTGTANVSGAVRFGGAVTFASNNAPVLAANTLTVTGQFLNVSTIGYFANIQANAIATFTSNTHLNGTWVNATANVVVSNPNTHITASATTITGGALTLASNTTVTGELSILNKFSIKNDYEVQVVANANIGVTTGSPLGVYSFDKTLYTSAKLMLQAISSDGTKRQLSDVAVVHDGTTSHIVVYGSVGSPNANNMLVSLTSVVSGSLVLVQATQTAPGIAVKVVAHLIK